MNQDIIKETMQNYPYPIAASVASAFSISEHSGYDAPYIKFDALMSCIESIARFIGIITVQELVYFLERPENSKAFLSNKIKNWFRNDSKILRPGFGMWLGLSRDILYYFENEGWKMVIPELSMLFNKSFILDISDEEIEIEPEEWTVSDAFNWASNFRNELTGQHIWDKNKISPKEMLLHCKLGAGLILNILESLDFLSRLKFGFIQEIRLKKTKRGKPLFIYTGKNLKGSTFIPQKQENLEIQSFYKETESVIIKYEKEKEYLNLFPFYIYQFEDIKSSDIFYFAKAEKYKILYMGVDKGGKLEVNKETKKTKLSKIKLLRPGTAYSSSNIHNDENNRVFTKSIPSILEELEYIITLIMEH